MKVSPRLAELLDLERAWKRVWRNRNTDFVLPGREYVATNRDPASLLTFLLDEIEEGDCRIAPLRRIDVLKPNHTLRPGAIPEIKDRILYQALVDAIADHTDDQLCGPPTVFGFELNKDKKKPDLFIKGGGFEEFRTRTAREYGDGHRFILTTDIAAYFECIKEEFLDQMLIGYGVDGAIADALVSLLGQWNRISPTGLPQGVWPSDFLGARLYLDRVDDAMNLLGYRYYRYSDDIRIAGDSMVEIRRGLRDLVIELRAVGLQVQAAKTRLMTPPRTPCGYEERQVGGPTRP